MFSSFLGEKYNFSKIYFPQSEIQPMPGEIDARWDSVSHHSDRSLLDIYFPLVLLIQNKYEAQD